MSQSQRPRLIKKIRIRPKTARVPVKLRAELTEYASLLRTMRMSEMSDLTEELIRAGKRRRDTHSDDSGEEEDEEDISGRPRKRTRLPVRSNKAQKQDQNDSDLEDVTVAADLFPFTKRKRQKDKIRNRDNLCTLWPAFPEHCPTPEFEFEEEIAAIAEEWLRDQNRSNPVQDANMREDDERTGVFVTTEAAIKYAHKPEDPMTAQNSRTQSLLSSTLGFLNTLLSSLAHHRPRTCHAVVGKTIPVKWVDVMEVVALMTNSELDYDALKCIESRLYEVYGPEKEQSIALKSFEVLSKSKQALQEMDRKFQMTLFEIPSIPSLEIRRRIQALQHSREDEEEQDLESDQLADDDGSMPEELEDQIAEVENEKSKRRRELDPGITTL